MISTIETINLGKKDYLDQYIGDWKKDIIFDIRPSFIMMPIYCSNKGNIPSQVVHLFQEEYSSDSIATIFGRYL